MRQCDVPPRAQRADDGLNPNALHNGNVSVTTRCCRSSSISTAQDRVRSRVGSGRSTPPSRESDTAIRRLELGNFSNVKGVGGGVFEYRVDFGPGYRVYFCQPMVRAAVRPPVRARSAYGFAQDPWPFGIVEAVWAVVALRRWRRCNDDSITRRGSTRHGGILDGEGIDMPAKSDVVHIDPDILSGTPVFVGTRVPVQSLFDYLEAGDTLDEFLRQFPSVKREQAVAALELARDTLLTSARSA
jgi:uncharacterized protein (DUF433 family)